MIEFEKLFEKNPFAYEALRTAYTIRGKEIPNGSRVQMTDWALSNGLGGRGRPSQGKKIGGKKNSISITVLLNGRKTASSYWAGFWMPA